MIMTIIRGCPGSGKSTLALKIGAAFFENDMFFRRNGEYTYDRNEIGKAIAWTQCQVLCALKSNIDVSVVGTLSRLKDVQYYVDLANKFGYSVRIIHCTNNFTSVHNVPADKIQYFKDTYEVYEGEEIYNVQDEAITQQGESDV